MKGGQYLALPPPDWDGHSPLPTTVFFHGWQSSAAAFASDPTFVAGFQARGQLLILPDGLGKSWSFHGSPKHGRDELAFMDAVRADMLRRWPVDTKRLLVSGFSIGGTMTWDLACYRGGDYAAFAPVSGAFWDPLPERCATPVNLLHTHGTADDVVPMGGRPIGDHARQGNVMRGLEIWRTVDGCQAAPSRTFEAHGLACEVWEGCASGKEIELCRHPGGHMIPDNWTGFVLDWAAGLER